MSEITPVRRRPAKKFYDRARKMEAAVYRLCSHNREDQECKRCLEEEHDPTYGTCRRMCRMLAEEQIAIILEELDRETTT